LWLHKAGAQWLHTVKREARLFLNCRYRWNNKRRIKLLSRRYLKLEDGHYKLNLQVVSARKGIASTAGLWVQPPVPRPDRSRCPK